MARNKGKRPNTTSGPKSQTSDQTKRADLAKSSATEDASKKTVATSSALTSQTSKTDGKPASGLSGAASATSTAASSNVSASVTSKTTSSGKSDSRPVADKGSVPSSKSEMTNDPNAAKKPMAATSATSASTLSSPPPSAGSSNNSSGFWPGLLGGLLGGAAMALLASLYWGGGDDGEVVAQLQSTTTELDSRLSAAESQVEQVGPLAERVAAVEAAPVAGEGGSDEVANRFSDLEQQLSDLREASESSMTTAAAGEAETGGTVPGDGAATNDRLAALEQQLSELNQAVTSSSEEQQAAGQTLAALQATLPTLEATLSATGTTVEEAGQQTAALSESVDTIRQTTEQLSGDLGSLSKDIGTLSDRVGTAENKLDYIGGEYQRAAAMVVAIGDVDRSIAKAEPFETALESLRALGQDDPGVGQSIAVLEPMAADGVPTLFDLKASFGEVGSRILLAKDGNETLADKVSGNVFSIINMRPAGAAAEGDDSRAIVARAQARLSANDLEGTIAELEGLSEAGAERAADWVADAKGRIAADAAIVDLRAHAQSLLAKGA